MSNVMGEYDKTARADRQIPLHKMSDFLSIPIGTSDGQLVFSCRGKGGEHNGYAVYSNEWEEIEDLLLWLLHGACKKYDPSELRLSFYNCADEAEHILGNASELPHTDCVQCVKTAEQLLEEIERLKAIHIERLRKIGNYADCYARAVKATREQGVAFSLPQALEIFIVPAHLLDVWESSFSVKRCLDFLMNELWRTGVYPIVIIYGAWSDFPFRSCFAEEVILSSALRLCRASVTLCPHQAFVSGAWDTWSMSANDDRMLEIPPYREVRDKTAAAHRKNEDI